MHDFIAMPLNYLPCNWRPEFDSANYVLYEAVKSAFCQRRSRWSICQTAHQSCSSSPPTTSLDEVWSSKHLIDFLYFLLLRFWGRRASWLAVTNLWISHHLQWIGSQALPFWLVNVSGSVGARRCVRTLDSMVFCARLRRRQCEPSKSFVNLLVLQRCRRHSLTVGSNHPAVFPTTLSAA